MEKNMGTSAKCKRSVGRGFDGFTTGTAGALLLFRARGMSWHELASGTDQNLHSQACFLPASQVWVMSLWVTTRHLGGNTNSNQVEIQTSPG